MPDLELTDEELAAVCGADFRAARQTRQELEGRKLAGYQLYRAWDEQTRPKGGQFAQQHGQTSPRGQFNWSRLTVPLGFIVVETILSRMVLQDPEIMAYGLSPDAASYAQAKVMRIKHDLQRCGWEDVQLVCLKDSCIYGDGYSKTVWDGDLRRPDISHVPWFDFWYSPEAMKHAEAEVHWHVTWHNKASLVALSELESRGERIYRNLELVIDRGGDRSTSDDTYLTRRQYAGAGSPQPPSLEQRQIPIVEGWYRDGTTVWLGGSAYDTVIRADPNPYEDPDGRPWRPFDTFFGTPDPESPYSISLIEMIEDFQREASTLTRQAIDQATRNINRPVKYDRNRVADADIVGAYSVPGGRLPTNGNPGDAVDEGTNVEISRDFETAINRVIQLAQMTAGISDESSGMPPTTKPGMEDTATASWLRAHERNRRVGYLTFLTSRTLKSISCKLDWLDRQYNKKPVTVPLTRHLSLGPGQEGVDIHPSGTVATISNDVNHKDLRYELKIDDGSLEVGFAGQKAARTIALSQALSTNPMLAQQVNWRELAAVMTEAAGIDPGRVLMTQQQGIPEPDPNVPPGVLAPDAGAAPPPGALPGMPVPGGAPPPDGAPPLGGPPAGVPVGPPIPLPGGNGGGAPSPDLGALLGGPPPPAGALPMGMPAPAMPEPALPAPAPAPPQPLEITINLNSGGQMTSKVIHRDEAGQISQIDEIPHEAAAPMSDLPSEAQPDMGAPPLDPSMIPPELLDQLGGQQP